jgi:hypothetical protein
MLTQSQYEAEVAAEREKRLTLLRAARAVLARKLKQLDNDRPAALKDVMAGIRMVSDQLRLEFKAGKVEDDAPDDDANQAPAAEDPLDGLKLHRPAG